MFLHGRNLQVQGGEGASAWTLTGDPPAQHHLLSAKQGTGRYLRSTMAISPTKVGPLQFDTAYCNLMELLLFEFTFKREEISKNARVLSPFLSLPLNL